MPAESGRANVKPLTHWIIYKGYSVRFTARSGSEVRGVLTTPEGQREFVYDPAARTVHLPDAILTINEYGWEVGREQRPGDCPPTTQATT